MNEYYKNCAVPKPGTAQKKKKVNGWKDKPNRVCAICGKRGAERHELFGGPNRQISIDNGFQVDLCREHHAAFHSQEGEWKDVVQEYRAKVQRLYELKLVGAGVTPEQARDVWMSLVGKNYI